MVTLDTNRMTADSAPAESPRRSSQSEGGNPKPRGAAAQAETAPVSASEIGEASAAGNRINKPINLAAWEHLDAATREALLWYHQHALDTGLSWEECAILIDSDTTTAWRVIHGTYTGDYRPIVQSIRLSRKIEEERASVARHEFAETPVTRMIFAGLDYALSQHSIALIVGPSRRGKTTAARQWRSENNHGRSVMITAPAYGGVKALLREIAQAVGASGRASGLQVLDSVQRAFSPERILIVDEAHRLLPSDGKLPVALEVLRDLHDRTGCALALLSTARFDGELRKSDYQYEQLLGRIGVPIRLPSSVDKPHFMPILRQYIRQPGEKAVSAASQVANERGSLGILVESLKFGSKIAKGAGKPMSDEHFLKALAIRKQMMGEGSFSAGK